MATFLDACHCLLCLRLCFAYLAHLLQKTPFVGLGKLWYTAGGEMCELLPASVHVRHRRFDLSPLQLNLDVSKSFREALRVESFARQLHL